MADTPALDPAGQHNPPPLVLVSEQMIDRSAGWAPVPAPAPGPARTPVLKKSRLLAPQIEIDGTAKGTLRSGRLSGVVGAGAAAIFQRSNAAAVDKGLIAAPADLDDEDDLANDISPTDEAGLIDFVDRVGVKSMADMLEAAAAYAICVEGRSQFTRPQLMRRLAICMRDQAVDREEGLRSFGSLLRTGRVEKLTRGNYTLSAASPYMAAARRFA